MTGIFFSSSSSALFNTIMKLSHRYSISVPFIVIHMRREREREREKSPTIHSSIHSFRQLSTIQRFARQHFFLISAARTPYAQCYVLIVRNHAVVSAPVFFSGLPTAFLSLLHFLVDYLSMSNNY